MDLCLAIKELVFFQSHRQNGVNHGLQKFNTMKGLNSDKASPLHNHSVDRRSQPNDHLALDHRPLRRLSGGCQDKVDRSPLHSSHSHKSRGSTTPRNIKQKSMVSL